MKFTPGPWREGNYKSTVVCDTPITEISGSDHVEYYGGHLICESVAPRNVSIIAAAPDMYEALISIENDDGSIPATIWALRNEALKKARGESDG